MWPFKRSYLDKDTIALVESWSVTHGSHSGRPMIVRRNAGAAAVAGHPAYGHQVGVAIPLRAPDDNGFPGSDEAAQLDALEDLLVERLGVERLCIHVATISTGGMRELVFYTSDPAAAHALLEQIAGETTAHEVQHIVQHDPKWKIYRRLG